MIRPNQLVLRRASAGLDKEEEQWISLDLGRRTLPNGKEGFRGDNVEKAKQDLFKPRAKAQKRSMWTELLSCKFGDSMEKYLQKMMDIRLRVESTGMSIDEDLMVAALARGLPKEYALYKTRLLSSHSSVEAVCDLLLEAEKSKLEMKKRFKSESIMSMRKRVKVRCYDCGRRGHRSGAAACPKHMAEHMHNYVQNLVNQFESIPSGFACHPER